MRTESTSLSPSGDMGGLTSGRVAGAAGSGLHYEASVERALGRITGTISRMAALNERALVDCMRALRGKDRQLAYAVIIRDQQIDLLEKELDLLCLEFLVRQQPAGGPLRLAYGAIKISTELERVGDYAESIAHQTTKLLDFELGDVVDRFEQMGELVVPMLRDAVRAFVAQDAGLATATIPVEATLDALKAQLRRDLIQRYRDGQLAFEALDPCLQVARRWERVSDQALNICEETLYQCTGSFTKHRGAESYRVLFFDRGNTGAGPLAVAAGEGMGLRDFVFESAGLAPSSPCAAVLGFLREKGFEAGRRAPKSLSEVPELDRYHVVIGLFAEARRHFPGRPRKVVFLEWPVEDPAEAQGSPESIRVVCERTFRSLQGRLGDLVQAIGTEPEGRSETRGENPSHHE